MPWHSHTAWRISIPLAAQAAAKQLSTFDRCHLLHFKEDTGEPSVPVQEFNPIACTPTADCLARGSIPGRRSHGWPVCTAASGLTHWATRAGTCPCHYNPFCCSTEIMFSIPSLSLNSLLETLSLTLSSHINLTILISAHWSATSFSFLRARSHFHATHYFT